MAERINKSAFIANILECFTLLQTYEECYKEILDIIDAVNGIEESEFNIANLKNMIEGSKYISFDENEAGTKLIISLDRTHVDEVVKEDSDNLVTSGAVFDAVGNATGDVLKLPIAVPTEPLVVMIGTNKAQTNVPLGDGLAYQNGHLVATGGSGGVTQSYVDTQDQTIKTECNNYTDGQVSDLNNSIGNLNDQLVATNTEVSNKVSKFKNIATDDFIWLYGATKSFPDVHKQCRIEPDVNTIPITDADLDRGYLYANNVSQADWDASEYSKAVVNMNTLKTYTQYKYIAQGVTNVFSAQQVFNKPILYDASNQDALIQVFEAHAEYSSVALLQTHYVLGSVHQVLTSISEEATTFYLLRCNKSVSTNVNYFILTNTDLGKGLEWNANKNQVDITHPVVKCTQSEYDSLTKDANTLYVIVG